MGDVALAFRFSPHLRLIAPGQARHHHGTADLKAVFIQYWLLASAIDLPRVGEHRARLGCAAGQRCPSLAHPGASR